MLNNKADRKLFLFSICISCIIWLFTTLSETYTTEIVVPVTYVNLPSNKLLVNELDEQLFILAEAKGMVLAKHLLGIAMKNIVVDYRKDINRAKISTMHLITAFKLQLANVKIERIRPDTIHFNFSDVSEKVLPIILQDDITTAQYFEVRKTAISPDSVVVIGPSLIIDSLKGWHTDKLVLRDVTQDFTSEIKLLPPQYPNITLSADYTTYFIKIEEFTEKRFDVPIVPKNLPPGIKIFPYPRKVTLQFQVGANDFELIGANDFNVVADFDTIDISNTTEIAINIAQQPPSVRNVRYFPKRVEYIIIN